MLKYPLINRRQLALLEVGDRVTRVFSTLPMKGIISKIEDDILTFTVLDDQKMIQEHARRGAQIVNDLMETKIDIDKIPFEQPFWTFLADTGLEVDEYLGWNGKDKTGSYLSIP